MLQKGIQYINYTIIDLLYFFIILHCCNLCYICNKII